MRILAVCAAMVLASPSSAATAITGLDFHGPGRATKAGGVYAAYLGADQPIDGHVTFDAPIAANFTGQLGLNRFNAVYETFADSSMDTFDLGGTGTYLNGRVKDFRLRYDDESITRYVTAHTFGYEQIYGGKGFYTGHLT